MARETIACGQCYSYAYERVTRKGGTLVHATVADPWSGKRYEHAWIEDKGKVYDWQTAQGLGKGKPQRIADFYRLYKPERIRRYDATAARVNILKYGHFGPWK